MLQQLALPVPCLAVDTWAGVIRAYVVEGQGGMRDSRFVDEFLRKRLFSFVLLVQLLECTWFRRKLHRSDG